MGREAIVFTCEIWQKYYKQQKLSIRQNVIVGSFCDIPRRLSTSIHDKTCHMSVTDRTSSILAIAPGPEVAFVRPG